MIFFIFGALSLCAGLHMALFSSVTDIARIFDFTAVILATQVIPFWFYRSPAASSGPEVFKVVIPSTCTDLAIRGPTDLAIISPVATAPDSEAPTVVVMSTCTDLAIRGPTDLADISRVPKALAAVPPPPFIGPLPILCFHAFSIRLDAEDLVPISVLTQADAPLLLDVQLPEINLTDFVYTPSDCVSSEEVARITTHVGLAIVSIGAYIVYVVSCALYALAPFTGPVFRHTARFSRKSMIVSSLQFIQTHTIVCFTVLDLSSCIGIQSEVSLFLALVYQVMLWHRVLNAPDDPRQFPSPLSLVVVDAGELGFSDHMEEHYVGHGQPTPSDDSAVGERIPPRAAIEPERVPLDPPVEVQTPADADTKHVASDVRAPQEKGNIVANTHPPDSTPLLIQGAQSGDPTSQVATEPLQPTRGATRGDGSSSTAHAPKLPTPETEVPTGKNGTDGPSLSSNNGIATPVTPVSNVDNATGEEHLVPEPSADLRSQGQQGDDKVDGNDTGSSGGKDSPLSTHTEIVPHSDTGAITVVGETTGDSTQNSTTNIQVSLKNDSRAVATECEHRAAGEGHLASETSADLRSQGQQSDAKLDGDVPGSLLGGKNCLASCSFLLPCPFADAAILLPATQLSIQTEKVPRSDTGTTAAVEEITGDSTQNSTTNVQVSQKTDSRAVAIEFEHGAGLSTSAAASSPSSPESQAVGIDTPVVHDPTLTQISRNCTGERRSNRRGMRARKNQQCKIMGRAESAQGDIQVAAGSAQAAGDARTMQESRASGELSAEGVAKGARARSDGGGKPGGRWNLKGRVKPRRADTRQGGSGRNSTVSSQAPSATNAAKDQRPWRLNVRVIHHELGLLRSKFRNAVTQS